MPDFQANKAAGDAVRIDRWLWAARFFKTRALAAEAIKKGHVDINQLRAKPARKVGMGDEVRLRKDRVEWVVEVVGLSERRLGAALAQALYRETTSSQEERARFAEQQRLASQGMKLQRGRPSKRDRRVLIRAKQQD